MARRGRQVHVFFDDESFQAIEEVAEEAGVGVTHVVEALARLLRDGELKPRQVQRLEREAAAVRSEREARTKRGPKPQD